jgi:uncharacterized protein YjdB
MSLVARRLVPVVLAAVLASCERVDPLCACSPAPTLTLRPASLTLVAGDSASLTVTVADVPERTTIRVVSQQPTVARVDTVARSGVPVTVRAAAVGTAVVLVSAPQYGQTVTGALPVTVTARPAP